LQQVAIVSRGRPGRSIARDSERRKLRIGERRERLRT
jgi:hypothetical protein